MTESPRISVIIATFRRPGLLRRCLRSLAEARQPQGEVEVVVVDDGGGLDDLGDVAMGLPLTCIRLARNQGQAAAQSAGVDSARGDVLVFLDDDAVVHPGWLEVIHGHFSSVEGVPAIVGRIQPFDPAHILVRMRQQVYERRHRCYTDPAFADRLRQEHQLQVPEGVLLSDHISGGNSAIRREVLKGVGGLAAQVRRSADDLLTRRLLRARQPIGYVPDMIIYHHHNQSYRQMMRHAFQEGRGREESRILAAGRRGPASVWAAARQLLAVPWAIRGFPEILQADRSQVKVFALFTLHESLVAAGKFYQSLLGSGMTNAREAPNG